MISLCVMILLHLVEAMARTSIQNSFFLQTTSFSLFKITISAKTNIEIKSRKANSEKMFAVLSFLYFFPDLYN